MADTELTTTSNGQIAPPLNLKGLNLRQINFIGEHMAKSGMFTDVKSASAALVKILAGQEIGVTPFQAMTNIHIIQGKATMSANLMAAKLKGSGKYDYRAKLSSESCTVTIYELEHNTITAKPTREELGAFTFTIKDAERAQLVKPNSGWTKYPQNMLFARAISTAVRLYAPDVFNGNVVYSPDELGGDVDADGNYIADATPTTTPPAPIVVAPEPEVTTEPETKADEDTDSAEAVAGLFSDDDSKAEVVPLNDTEDDTPETGEDDALDELKLSELIDILKSEFAAHGITETEDKLAYCNNVLDKARPASKDDYKTVIKALRKDITS